MIEELTIDQRLRVGRTNLRKLLLASGFGDQEAQEYLVNNSTLEVPDSHQGIQGLIEMVLRCDRHTWARVALVAADAQFFDLPGMLKRICREMIDQAYACVVVPANDEVRHRLDRSRKRASKVYNHWLDDRCRPGDERDQKASHAFLAVGLSITCIQELIPREGGSFMIASPDLFLRYLNNSAVQAQFARIVTRDLLPWLRGEQG